MPQFILKTHIHAPIEVCFDLARSIDLHMDTMKHTGEKAIAGVTSGLIGLNETVTWQAKHFGVNMKLTSKITECEFPILFSDEMVKGPFKMMRHKHLFKQKEGYTLMVDEFEFKSPFGILGNLVNAVILTNYMENLIKQRNRVIKLSAESATVQAQVNDI